MAVLYVTEYPHFNLHSDVAVEPPLAEQTVAIGAGSVQSSTFNPSTGAVRLHTDAICSVEFGVNPTATATKRRMAANTTEWIRLPRGQSYKVAVITNT